MSNAYGYEKPVNKLDQHTKYRRKYITGQIAATKRKLEALEREAHRLGVIVENSNEGDYHA